MKIYVNRNLVGDLKGWSRKKGEFLTILNGVSVNQVNGNLEIEPIYASLMRWEKHTGQIVVVIGFDFPMRMLVLQWRYPFVQHWTLKGGEDED